MVSFTDRYAHASAKIRDMASRPPALCGWSQVDVLSFTAILDELDAFMGLFGSLEVAKALADQANGSGDVVKGDVVDVEEVEELRKKAEEAEAKLADALRERAQEVQELQDRVDRLDRVDRVDRLDRLDRVDRLDRLDRVDQGAGDQGAVDAVAVTVAVDEDEGVVDDVKVEGVDQEELAELRRQKGKKILAILQQFPQLDQDVMLMRYGLTGEGIATRKEIGQALGVSHDTVKRAEVRGIWRLITGITQAPPGWTL